MQLSLLQDAGFCLFDMHLAWSRLPVTKDHLVSLSCVTFSHTNGKDFPHWVFCLARMEGLLHDIRCSNGGVFWLASALDCIPACWVWYSPSQALNTAVR
jgi:hypothetical protein